MVFFFSLSHVKRAASWAVLCMSLVFAEGKKKRLLSFPRQEINTTIPAVHGAAGVIRCSPKERRCICKVSKSFTLLQGVDFF